MSTGYRFATSEILIYIYNAAHQTKNDALKISCFISMANLVLIDNTQAETLINHITLKQLVALFIDSHQRV